MCQILRGQVRHVLHTHEEWPEPASVGGVAGHPPGWVAATRTGPPVGGRATPLQTVCGAAHHPLSSYA